MSSAYRTASAVKRALANASPERFSAAGNDTTNAITMSRKLERGFEMFAEILMGGNGAGPENDGAEVVAQMLSNTGNTPVEAIEMDHDFVRIAGYELIQDSGGAGVQRGGLGFRRVYDILEDGILISTNGDRHNTPPWSLAGGHEGNLSAHILVRDGVETHVPAASNIECQKGDRFIVEISGGGGYGDPSERNRALVQDDLRCGRISAKSASAIYGLDQQELAAE
jgi:N-methylhydantoinase B